jgi:hypothetical protein
MRVEKDAVSTQCSLTLHNTCDNADSTKDKRQIIPLACDCPWIEQKDGSRTPKRKRGSRRSWKGVTWT